MQKSNLSILTSAELNMLEKLSAKLESQNASMIILPEDPKPAWLESSNEDYSNYSDIDNEEDDYEAEAEPPLKRTKFRNQIQPVESIRLEPLR